jgi:hypothetical protein
MRRPPWKSWPKIARVHAVHAYPRTALVVVVVWYSPTLCAREAIKMAVAAAEHVPADLAPARAPALPMSRTPMCCGW